LSAEAFRIRPAELADVERIAQVSIAARGVATDTSDAVSDAARFVVVAEAAGEIVGWAKTHHYENAAGSAPSGHYLGGVNVEPVFQRRGIGSALTRVRLEWIFARAPDAWFVTNSNNGASIAMHAGLGFAEVERGSEFHGVTFDGGAGILFHASRALRPTAGSPDGQPEAGGSVAGWASRASCARHRT
jgi:aminoglycoside 6'-N-acetyltransferase I